MIRSTRFWLSVIALVACLSVGVERAEAISLDDAKAQGLVGERPDGYLGVVSGGSEAKEVVDKTNALRREKYQEIAKKNGAPLSAVERMAGEKAIERTPSGQFYLSASGKWEKK